MVFDDGVTFSFPTGIDPKAPSTTENWHYYEVNRKMPTVIASNSQWAPARVMAKYRFELQDVWMALRDYPALEYTNSGKADDMGDPVKTGDVTQVDLFGPVVHIVDDAKMVLINKTLPSHTLHEGFVARHIYAVSPHVIQLNSVGFGVGAYARINEFGSQPVWGNVSTNTIRTIASRYYKQRTGQDSLVLPKNPAFGSIPEIYDGQR